LLSEVTQLLSALEQGHPHAASRLLRLVYKGWVSLSATFSSATLAA
jgi:hypothetical protein